MSDTGAEDLAEDLADPVDDPDSDDPDVATTFNPDDPESIQESLEPSPEAPGAGPAPTCRHALREATERFPTRVRIHDGIMGDMSHMARKSDHNQGNAFDLSDDPNSGCDAHGLVEDLRRRRDPRVKYIISLRRIWNPSISDAWRPYRGENPHVKHAHVSIRASARDDAGDWWADAGPGSRTPTETEVDMPKPNDVTDEVEFGGGVLHLTFDGGIRVLDRAFKPHTDARAVVPFTPFSYPGLPPEARQGERGFYRLRVDASGTGYTLVATDGSRYHFPV